MTLRNVLLAGATSIALAGFATAAETPSGLYVDGQLGANWIDKFDSLKGVNDFDYGHNTGWAVAGSVGYKLDTLPVRFEIELGYRDNTLLFSVPGIGGGGDGSTSVFSQMVNVMYDIDLAPGTVFSIGGGVGGASINVKGGFDGASGNNLVNDDDYVFAYQGAAELEVMTSDNMGLYVGYNYFRADSFEIGVAPGYLAGGVFEDDYAAHTVFAGLRWHFNAADAAPPPPAPPAPPPPPSAAKTFIVFFNFDRSDLTPEAQAVVAEAAAAYQAGSSVNLAVQVRGHTDTVGSAAYNLPLSERRAASVKSSLVANGVPDSAVSTSGAGFSEPLVPTGPGVKEPQNRRATIDLTGAGS
jgi:outer membrane protein OmpA-like peptidoglycan-associated protein